MYWKILYICYNQSRDVMEKIEIKVYSKLNNIEENNEFLAIKDNNVIKYNDLENNKMIIDTKNNIIERENSDYLFKIKLNDNEIEITMRKLNKKFIKKIKTLSISLTKKRYLVRYFLEDENIINEYYVNFWK